MRLPATPGCSTRSESPQTVAAQGAQAPCRSRAAPLSTWGTFPLRAEHGAPCRRAGESGKVIAVNKKGSKLTVEEKRIHLIAVGCANPDCPSPSQPTQACPVTALRAAP